jgi:hypothetical protein
MRGVYIIWEFVYNLIIFFVLENKILLNKNGFLIFIFLILLKII